MDGIAIVGLGAIGGWVAARLALAGNAVVALAREAATTRTLVLHDETGTERVPIRCAPAADLGEQQLVVIAVKATALADAAEAARPLIGPDTIVVPMLNGVPWWFIAGQRLETVDPDRRIAAAIPLDQLVGCVVHAAVERDAADEVRVVHADRLLFGNVNLGQPEEAERVARLFGWAGFRAEVVPDIRRAIWYKLWGNMTFNPVSALTLATGDRITGQPDVRAFILACMAEAAAVGARIGCPILESGEERLALTERLGPFRSSMLQDVEAGRPIELEALVGAPREIARREGVATPNIDALYGLTRLMAESRGLT